MLSTQTNVAVPLAQNRALKHKLISTSIFVALAVLVVEYSLNPHAIVETREPVWAGNRTYLTLSPPCIAVEPYVAYNIFMLGVPLAIFLHVKLAIFNLCGQIGLCTCTEAFFVLITLSFDEIRSFHALNCFFLLLNAICIFAMLDAGESMARESSILCMIPNGSLVYIAKVDTRKWWRRWWRTCIFALPVASVALFVGIYDGIYGYSWSQLSTPVSAGYAGCFCWWILMQYSLVHSDTPPASASIDVFVASVFAIATLVTMITIHEWPDMFKGNERRPWET